MYNARKNIVLTGLEIAGCVANERYMSRCCTSDSTCIITYCVKLNGICDNALTYDTV